MHHDVFMTQLTLAFITLMALSAFAANTSAGAQSRMFSAADVRRDQCRSRGWTGRLQRQPLSSPRPRSDVQYIIAVTNPGNLARSGASPSSVCAWTLRPDALPSGAQLHPGSRKGAGRDDSCDARPSPGRSYCAQPANRSRPAHDASGQRGSRLRHTAPSQGPARSLRPSMSAISFDSGCPDGDRDRPARPDRAYCSCVVRAGHRPSTCSLVWTMRSAYGLRRDNLRMGSPTRPANRSRERSERLAKVGGATAGY